MSGLKTPWPSATFIAFDLETSGRYPLESEICEMAAVKWRGGQVIDTFQTLIKPAQLMSQEVIAIHHISNEMVADAPRILDKIAEFRKFVDDGYLIAHHAPFDLGFLAWELEKAKLSFPLKQIFCTSLLSRQVIIGVENHRLQSLAKHFLIETAQAHRALEDSQVCLQIALKCFELVGPQATLEEIQRVQGKLIQWKDYSIEDLLERDTTRQLIRAILDHLEIELVYKGGSRSGQSRRVFPIGLVRNPEGDFLVACEGEDPQTKRYFLDKIAGVGPVRERD